MLKNVENWKNVENFEKFWKSRKCQKILKILEICWWFCKMLEILKNLKIFEKVTTPSVYGLKFDIFKSTDIWIYHVVMATLHLWCMLFIFFCKKIT